MVPVFCEDRILLQNLLFARSPVSFWLVFFNREFVMLTSLRSTVK